MKNVLIDIAKLGTKFCVDRTVAEGIQNVTASFGDTNVRKVIKFVGRETLSLCITCSISNIIDEKIDKAADKIADVIVKIKDNTN